MSGLIDVHASLLAQVESGDLPGVLFSLKQGADANGKKDGGWSCLKMALQTRRSDIADALLDAGADAKDGALLLLAAKNGMTDVAMRLISMDCPLQKASDLGITPLLLAAENNHLECTRALLFAGADPFALSKDGVSVLHSAATHGNFRMIESWLESAHKKMAQAGTPDSLIPFLNQKEKKTGHTALHRAASVEMGAACAMTLLQAGADVNLTNEAGHMPIHLSANNNRAQSINILLSHGASVNHEGGCGYSAFQLACSKGHEKAFDAMWSAQPDIHAPRKNDGNSPLHFASSSARVGMVEKLLGAGANANAVNWKGETPLFAVAENATSSQDKSKQENFLLVAAKLLDSGCCSDARNDTGQTVLHRAAHHGNGDLIALMASRGADIHAKNNAGVSIQSVARRKGHVKLVEEIEALQSSRRASAAIDRILMDQDRSLSPGAAP